MRDCKKNSRKLWYSNLLGNEPVLDENGDETGDTKPVYGIPIPFMASVSPGKGNAYADVFGLYTFDFHNSETSYHGRIIDLVWLNADYRLRQFI